MRSFLVILSVFIFAILVFLITWVTRAASEEDWSVEIVPTVITAERNIIKADGNDPYFYVIITNRTDRDLKVWREWNSWGHDSLTFTVWPKEGPAFTLVKPPAAWLWNGPDSTIVPAGKSFVLQATIEQSETKHFEGFPEGYRGGGATIQAHFTIKEDEESKKRGVWTGRVSSAPMEVNIWGLD